MVVLFYLTSIEPGSYITSLPPRRLYQISHKFRDELRPRFGMIRANEFCMKDLYTFDRDIEAARQTYSEVSR